MIWKKVTDNIHPKEFEQKFTGIFENEKMKVYARAYRILGNREDAEEASQTVFLKLWEKFEEMEEIENISAWLQKTTTNTCIDRLRALKARKRVMPFQAELEVFNNKTPGFAEDITVREELKSLASSIDKLSPGERVAFSLYIFEGLSSKEIAMQMGSSPSTVRNQVMKAREKIKKQIREKDEK